MLKINDSSSALIDSHTWQGVPVLIYGPFHQSGRKVLLPLTLFVQQTSFSLGIDYANPLACFFFLPDCLLCLEMIGHSAHSCGPYAARCHCQGWVTAWILYQRSPEGTGMALSTAWALCPAGQAAGPLLRAVQPTALHGFRSMLNWWEKGRLVN